MSKFTPGPWLTKTYTNHELQTDFAMVMMGDWVHMIGYSDEDKANAHLIAAAPAMYEALKELLDVRGKTACMVLEAQEKARKVLRVADGGKP